ncbi:glycosyltransferase [Oenococcus oeni]|uniref:glycosyltransferase n=1 Tax=Oenococcus oeni TaxID=1247 RepID=UPI000DAAD92D|nr:glycosyl transferase family 2 [Oenococcus phage phiOE33PA]
MLREVKYEDAVHNKIFDDLVSKRVVAVIPSHNEENDIANALRSLTKQHVPSGCILNVFVIEDNCSDGTDKEVKKFSDQLNLYVIKTVNNKDRKAGALNTFYRLMFGDNTKDSLASNHIKAVNNIEAFLAMDADVILAKDCLSTMYKELKSTYGVASVSANVQCLLPEKVKKVPFNIPDREYLIKHGKYGNAFARWITVLQNVSFASWSLKQKSNNYSIEIANGQSTLFSFQAMKSVYDNNRMNILYSNSTDTEDEKLTEDLRKLGWTCKISNSARTYADSMKTMSSWYRQAKKWHSGLVQQQLESGISTAYSRILWGRQLILWINAIIRILLIILVPVALSIKDYKWNYIFFLPILISAILNFISMLKTPIKRPIDVLFALTTIPSEFQVWLDIIVDMSVCRDMFRVNKVDGWAIQYAAENGTLKKNHNWVYISLTLIAAISLGFYMKWLNVSLVINTIKPYLNAGFNILTYLTVIMFLFMLIQLNKFRGNFRA